MIARAAASVLALALVVPACVIVVDGNGRLHRHFGSVDEVRGSGVLASESRTVEPFTKIAVEGSTDATVRVGEAQSVVVRGDDNLVGRVTTEVREGTLWIGMKSGSHRPRRALEVDVAVPALESIQVIGSADVGVGGVAGEAFGVHVRGSGDVAASGKVARLDASVSGSGDVDLRKVEAKETRVSVSGSGDVAVGTTETLVISISGSGDVSYRGDPKVTKSVAGSGDVIRRD